MIGNNTCKPKRQHNESCKKNYHCGANLRCQTVRERGKNTRKCKIS